MKVQAHRRTADELPTWRKIVRGTVASPIDTSGPSTVYRMTNYSSLRLAAASLPTMTPGQESAAWRALFKSADTATRKAMVDIAHSVVAAPTTDTPKPPPFAAAALSAAIVDDRRATLSRYFGIPLPGAAL